MVHASKFPRRQVLNWSIAGCLVVGAAAVLLLHGAANRRPRAALAHGQSELRLSPRLDTWRVIGPGGGGAQYTPTVSPHDPNFLVVACDMSGSYLSRDGGATWRMFNLWSRVRHFAFDPNNPKVLYAATYGLWRSADEGVTWELVYPAGTAARGITFVGDDDAGAMMTGGGSTPVGTVTVDPADSRVVYFSIGNILYMTRNQGQKWEELGRTTGVPGGVRKIYVDPRSPVDDRLLYLVGSNWVARWKSKKVQDFTIPHGNGWIYDIAYGVRASDSQPILYVVVDYKENEEGLTGGILVSRDGGVTWDPVDRSLLALRPDGARFPEIRAIAAAASNPDIVYISYGGLALADGGSEPYFGVARSGDGGASWTPVWKEFSNVTAENISDAWVAGPSFGADWAEHPLSLGVAPNQPDAVYGTDFARTMRSTDGGQTWEQLYSQRVEERGYASTGLDVTTCYGIHFDPHDRNRMLISYTDIGPFLSEDGGQSWVSARGGIPRAWRNTTYWAVFDPEVPGRVWAATSGTHDLPRIKMFRATSPATFKGGVVISADGGKTWGSSSEGLPVGAFTHLVLDPRSSAASRVLYAVAFGHGVFKSEDGGATWSSKNDGLPATPLAWRLTLSPHGALYLTLIRKSQDGKYGNEQDGMVFRSSDGGGSWSRIALPDGVNGPVSVTADPEDPKRLYLSTWGRYQYGAGRPAQQGGIYLSADAGASWKNVMADNQYIYDITVSPHNPNHLFAGTFQASILSSTDRGATWRRVQGYNFRAAHRVIPDPYNPEMIYVTTYGGSVWYGPAAGDPRAVEDIAGPPQMRFTR